MENPPKVNPQDEAAAPAPGTAAPDMAAPDMAAMVASRICHDLIGPIGAIVNGLELLEMAGGTPGPEQELIVQSAESASAKLRFFRIAFGTPGSQSVGGTDIATLLEEIGRDSRLQVTWQPEGAQPRSAVRLAFLALLCCEAALPRGGHAHVIEEDGAWTVTASGAPVAVDPDIWAFVEGAGDTAALPPAKVQFALLPVIAAGLGRELRGEYDDAALTLRF